MAEIVNITGVIQKIAQEKASNGNMFASVEVLPDGSKYSVTLRAWDEEPIALCLSLEKGAWAAFKVRVSEKDRADGTSYKVRNILGVGEAAGAIEQKITNEIIELTGLPPEGTDKDKLIVDQVLTKIAADIYCSRDDESPEACAGEAIRLWKAIRKRHVEEAEEPEDFSDEDESMEVLI